jgi:hypothetical protein
MFWASTAHHQEVRRIYVANGTSKMTVGEPHTYTLSPDDGLLLPETCRDISVDGRLVSRLQSYHSVCT